MQSGIPNNIEEGAATARDLITKSNADGNTVNQGSPLTPSNTASTAGQAAPQGEGNTQTNPAPNATPNEGSHMQSTPDQPAGNAPTPDQNRPQEPSQSEIVLAGKYRKEVPELNRTIKMHESNIEILQSQNARLKKDIQDLQQRLATAPQKQESSVPDDPKSLMDALNPDDFNVYGDEFVNLAKILKDSFAQIQKPQAHQPQQPQQTQGRTPEQKAYDNILFAAFGENTFHDINRDPRFVNDFLNQVNPATSRYYRSDLLESHEDMDSASVIKIFRAFIDSLGGRYTPYVPPQRNTNQNPVDNRQNPQPITPQQNSVQPPPGNINNASPTPNMAASNTTLSPHQMNNTNAETFTQQQVDAFYKSITPGVGEFAGPQHTEWASDMKRRILAAYNTGRVFKNI